MDKFKLPASLRKYLRCEKSRIRREILDTEEAEKKISELVEKVFKQHLHWGGRDVKLKKVP